MKSGDHVTWVHTPRGGYGYSMPVDVQIVALHGKHATVRVKKRSGEVVLRRVARSSLRKKPTCVKGLVHLDEPHLHNRIRAHVANGVLVL
jgi:hypothetical protein